MKIKITDKAFNYEKEDIFEKLRKQKKTKNNKKYNWNIYANKLTVDNNAYNKINTEQKVNLR